MLRSNLSTSPFYNVLFVRTLLSVAVGSLLIVTTINIARIVVHSRSQGSLVAQIAEEEARTSQLQAEAAQIRTQFNPAAIALVTAAADEANGIIERRVFSWSWLFERFETSLPDDVRIISLRPRSNEDGQLIITVGAEGQTVESLDRLIESLEADGSFTSVLAVQEIVIESGLVQALIEATYLAPALPFEGSVNR